jgi:SAM-dependent methyltransferase
VKRFAPATERNRGPIRDVLARVLPAAGTVLEIASGSGEHAVAFAQAFPALTWQPSDQDPTALASIAAWRAEAAVQNLAAPIELDVMKPWPDLAPAAVVCINMVHISPWEATLALFAHAGRILAPGALLYLYGPYQFSGAFAAESNAEFDRSLRARDPRWGVRDVDDLVEVARRSGVELVETVAMPANNHSLIFRR